MVKPAPTVFLFFQTFVAFEQRHYQFIFFVFFGGILVGWGTAISNSKGRRDGVESPREMFCFNGLVKKKH